MTFRPDLKLLFKPQCFLKWLGEDFMALNPAAVFYVASPMIIPAILKDVYHFWSCVLYI